MRRSLQAVLGTVLCAAMLHASDGRAETPVASERFGFGRQALSLTTGYGVGTRLSGSLGDALETETVPILPRWSIGITDPFGEAPFRGNLDAGVEGIFLVNTEPHAGSAQGGGPFLRFNLLAWDCIVPYAGVSAGMVNLAYDLNTQHDGFNFVLAGELGVQALVAEQVAVSVGYRLQHISNAGTQSPNLAVDTNFGTIGVTYFLR